MSERDRHDDPVINGPHLARIAALIVAAGGVWLVVGLALAEVARVALGAFS